MESRRRKAKPGSTRRVSAKTIASEALDSSEAQSLVLPHLEIFLQGDGAQFSIGAIGPIQCAAVASDDYNMQAALVRRQGETLQHLLARLDAAVALAMEEDIFTDEINPPPRG